MRPTRAVITGASSGIGEAFANLLAEDKTNLVLVARRTDRLELLAKDLRAKYGIEVECVSLDITSPDAAKKLVDTCTRDGRIVDMLINNAGAGPYQNFLKVPIEKHTNIISLNMTALTELCHHFGTHMMAHKKKSWILNVSSVAAYLAGPNFAVYAATKSYVKVFSQVLDVELRSTNVSVTCLCPGPTQTEFMEKSGQKITGGQMFFMSASKCAQIGLSASFAGRSVIIPGVLNKLSCWLGRLIPARWSIIITGMAMDMGVEAHEQN